MDVAETQRSIRVRVRWVMLMSRCIASLGRRFKTFFSRFPFLNPLGKRNAQCVMLGAGPLYLSGARRGEMRRFVPLSPGRNSGSTSTSRGTCTP